jgi:hypothetical protein
VTVILIIVAAVVALVIGVVTNLYSEALGSRYPRVLELLKRKPIAAGMLLLFIIVVASLLQMAESASSSQTDTALPPDGRRNATDLPRTATAISSKSPSSTATSPNTTPRVQYKGEVTIITSAKDLDRVPPVKAEEEDGGDFEYNLINGKIYANGDASLAIWDAGGQPSYHDCTDRAAAASRTSLSLKVGDTVCALTNEGRTVRMKVNKQCDGYCAIFETVVWERPQ